MSDYISREAFVAEQRRLYCADCDRRKGTKNGKTVFCYEIGDAPCRACRFDDVLTSLEDYPAADVVEVVRCADCSVPHNRWTGCPKLGGLVTPPKFYCAFSERKDGDGDDD